ncbi:MAG: amidohydrolase [Synergistaceae bacterium]|jgi:amidohydrolase|nr:amidohydrolase [Synergistaceae bacterium]
MIGGISSAIKDSVKKFHHEAVELSDYLAANPELSSAEYNSSAKIARLLERRGFSVEYPFFGLDTAFKADFDNGPGPHIAIMVEYDALPDIGHGCGHNLHGSLSALAGLALMELKDLYRGKIHLIGAPAEETDGAKTAMAEGGVFDGMSLSMMMHCIGGGVCQPNMDALSLRNFLMEFRGVGAHAVAAPWRGRSALAAARKFLDLVDARRECFTPDIRVNGVITDGGRKPSIIPERAEIEIEFRANSMAKLARLDETIGKCARAAAMALDCEVTWRKSFADFADMLRLGTLEEKMSEILAGVGLKVSEVSPPVGSSDVGNVSYRCPSIQPLLSITDEPLALHTAEFARSTTTPQAHEAMASGAEALAALALDVLNDDDFRNAVKDDFSKQVAAKTGGE